MFGAWSENTPELTKTHFTTVKWVLVFRFFFSQAPRRL